MSVVHVIWLILLLSAIQPLLQQRPLLVRRVQALRLLEKQRGSRVIILIHGQETSSFFCLPFARYIDIEDSEELPRAIELTNPAQGRGARRVWTPRDRVWRRNGLRRGLLSDA